MFATEGKRGVVGTKKKNQVHMYGFFSPATRAGLLSIGCGDTERNHGVTDLCLIFSKRDVSVHATQTSHNLKMSTIQSQEDSL